MQFDPELCTGCAICKFRCTSRAITFKAGKGEFTWSYDPAQCTFCGRCVEGCIEHALKEGRTEHALSQESACPPIYLKQGELKKLHGRAQNAGSQGSRGSDRHATRRNARNTGGAQ